MILRLLCVPFHVVHAASTWCALLNFPVFVTVVTSVCFIFVCGWVKWPKCISPQTHCEGLGGAARSPSVRLGFQMFPSNGLSTCIILFLLLLTAWGRIRSTRRCAVAHIQQITDYWYKKPVTYGCVRTQILLQGIGARMWEFYVFFFLPATQVARDLKCLLK